MEVKTKIADPRQSTLLKNDRPLNSPQPTADKAKKQTGTKDEPPPNNSEILVVHVQVQRLESRQPPEDYEILLLKFPDGGV